jgi:hypothetical protein
LRMALISRGAWRLIVPNHKPTLAPKPLAFQLLLK